MGHLYIYSIYSPIGVLSKSYRTGLFEDVIPQIGTSVSEICVLGELCRAHRGEAMAFGDIVHIADGKSPTR